VVSSREKIDSKTKKNSKEMGISRKHRKEKTNARTSRRDGKKERIKWNPWYQKTEPENR
jgi:hypothetical protein